MKKFFFLAFLVLSTSSIFAQVKFGVRGGFSSASVNADERNIPDDNMDTLALNVLDLKGGYHIGLFMQANIGKFFIQPEVLFNSNRADFTLRDLSDPDGRNEILRERYNYMDIPLMMGLRLGALRLQAGPIGHLYLDNKSDLFEIDGYKQRFQDMTFGYQTGIGLDIWNVVLDLKYEGNFNKFGEHIIIEDEDINFSDTPSRWVFSLGVAF